MELTRCETHTHAHQKGKLKRLPLQQCGREWGRDIKNAASQPFQTFAVILLMYWLNTCLTTRMS